MAHHSMLPVYLLLGAAACSHSGERAPAAEPVGKMQKSDRDFSKNDPAFGRTCAGDADCETGDLCHPGHGRCISGYPNQRMLDISLLNEACKLTNLYFPFDSIELVEEARRWLAYDVRCIKSRGGKGVILRAHADKQGDSDYNLDLSRRRGEAVKAELQALGIEGTIRVVPKGDKVPLAAGKSERDYAWNRRVEFLME